MIIIIIIIIIIKAISNIQGTAPALVNLLTIRGREGHFTFMEFWVYCNIKGIQNENCEVWK